jgi:ribonucleoside-diphosphate reductase alpha chain
MKQQEISVEVWNDNYRAPGENSPEDTWKREAKACSEIEDESVREKVYNDFLWLLSDYRGMAGGRITANIGVEDRQATTLFNCFVHAPGDINYKDPDSIEGIYDMLKAQAHTLKSEGGYGMSFSWIRPNGSYVKGIGSRTPGVLKFMELWDKSSEIITMGSEEVLSEKKASEKKKIRKGAQMGSIAVWHPEVEAFIDAKLTSNRLTKFNLSVGITEGFMEAVEKDEIWKLKFPDTSCKEYKTEWFGDIYDWENKGYPVVIHKEIKANIFGIRL